MFSAEVVVMPEGRRRLDRLPVQVPGQLSADGGWRAVCRITDMSRFGARIVAGTPMRRDAVLWITLPNFKPIRARVMWVDDLDAGCLFHRPLDRQTFDTLAAQFGLQLDDDAPGSLRARH